MATNKSKIFLVNSGRTSLTTLTETAYMREEHLQEFLARYPDLIPGDQISDPPCRWMLISREMSVADSEGGGGRWSLDHLFVDQNSVPTFVECKRSSDTRGRREVVAQMLDYAANGVDYWSAAQIREAARTTCEAAGTTLGQALAALRDVPEHEISEQATEEFWNLLADNLQKRRIRLIFVADEIPRELKKLVEFLNEEMTNVEVLAVEVKQYLEPQDQHTVLVPTVVGATRRAQIAKQAGSKDKINAEMFLSQCEDPEKDFFRELFTRATACDAIISWGTVGCSIRVRDSDGRPHSIAYCYPPNEFSFNLDTNATTDSALREAIRQQLTASGLVREAGQYTFRARVEPAGFHRLLDQFEAVVRSFQASYNA